MNGYSRADHPLSDAVRNILRGLTLVSLILACGCRNGIHDFPDAPGHGALGAGDRSANDQADLFLPKKIDILPFTKPASFDQDPVPDGLDVWLRPLDDFGDQTKAIGVFHFELYRFRKASSDARGHRLALWEVDLGTKSAQEKHWDRITRMYRFRLMWLGKRPKQGKYVLEVTYIPHRGPRISSIYIIESKVPPGKLKEESQQRRKRFGLF